MQIACLLKMNIVNIASGENHSLAYTSDPAVLWSWGKHDQGQLGLGEVGKLPNPRVVQSLCSVNIPKVFS